MIRKFFSTEAEMLEFAAQLANIVLAAIKNMPRENATIIFLSGPLGAGKTTLTRGFLRGLSYHEKVKSPTYTLVESYQVKNFKVFHFDFYRIQDVKELDYIGLEDYFTDDAICLIEWPEKANPLLPNSDLSCYIAIKAQGRELQLVAHTKRGENILRQL